MNTGTVIVAAMLAAISPSVAMAGELRPTHELVAKARQQQQEQQPDQKIQPGEYEYHFRNVGGNILFCAYYSGGNGGFCTTIDRKYIARVDKSAVEFCREQPNGDAPHAVYGEAYDLHYTCKESRMTRLPYSYGFDEEGYVRSQWQVLH
jgi:hypothetical protein